MSLPRFRIFARYGLQMYIKLTGTKVESCIYGTPEGTFPFRYLSEIKTKISCLIDLSHRLNDVISRQNDIK